MAAAGTPPGALLDEPTRAHLASLYSLLSIGRGTTESETCLLAIDRAFTHARADCAAITPARRRRGLIVAAQRGFRLPLEVRSDEGIVGRALAVEEVVQGGPGLGGPDALLERHGLTAALAIPVPDHTGRPLGAFLVGRRRPVPFEPDTIGALVVAAARLGESLQPRPDGPREEAAPAAFFESLDPSRTAAAVASAATARLGADAAAILWPDGDRFVLAGGAGLPDERDGAERLANDRDRRGDARALRPGRGRAVGSGARTVPGRDAAGRAAALGGRLADRPPRGRRRAALRDRAVAGLHASGRRRAPERASARRVGSLRPRGADRGRAATDRGPRRRRRPARGHGEPPGGRSRSAGARSETAWGTPKPRGISSTRRRPRGESRRVSDGSLASRRASGAHAAAPVDISAAIRDSVRATERLWATEGVVPSVTLDLEPVPPVRVHPDELRHAVHHLLQNAREAGDSAAR